MATCSILLIFTADVPALRLRMFVSVWQTGRVSQGDHLCAGRVVLGPPINLVPAKVARQQRKLYRRHQRQLRSDDQERQPIAAETNTPAFAVLVDALRFRR